MKNAAASVRMEAEWKLIELPAPPPLEYKDDRDCTADNRREAPPMN